MLVEVGKSPLHVHSPWHCFRRELGINLAAELSTTTHRSQVSCRRIQRCGAQAKTSMGKAEARLFPLPSIKVEARQADKASLDKPVELLKRPRPEDGVGRTSCCAQGLQAPQQRPARPAHQEEMCAAVEAKSPMGAPRNSKLRSLLLPSVRRRRASGKCPTKSPTAMSPVATTSHFRRFKRRPSSAARRCVCANAAATAGTSPASTPSSR